MRGLNVTFTGNGGARHGGAGLGTGLTCSFVSQGTRWLGLLLPFPSVCSWVEFKNHS